MDKEYTPDNPISGLPADSGGPQPSVPNRPSGQPGPAPNAPDVGQPADVAGAGATSALGGGVTGPAKPGLGQRVAQFIGGGQATPGSVWRGILSGALTGMVAGSSQGHFGGGVAVGGAAEQKQAQQNLQNKMAAQAQATEQKVRQAQIALTNHQITESAWNLSAQQAKAAQEQSTLENNLVKEAMQSGGQDLGVARNLDDVVKLHQNDPGFADKLAKGQIMSVPHFTEKDGQLVYDGVRGVLVNPDFANEKIDHDMSYPRFVAGAKPGEPGHWEEQTLAKGTVSNAEANQIIQKNSELAAKYDSDLAIGKAQQAAAAAQLSLAKAAANAQDAATLKDQSEQLGQQLYDGDMTLSLMGRTNPKLRAAAQAVANRISIEKTGHLFNATDNEVFYNDKKKTLASFTAGEDAAQITAFNTAIAHLGELAEAAKALNNGNFEPLNNLAAELSRLTGSKVPATYDAVHAAVTGEVGSVYKKGAPSEGEITRLDDTFHRSQSPASSEGAIGETINLMMGKLTALDNKFRNGTRGKSPADYGINMISPESAQTLANFNIQPPQRISVGAVAPQAPEGKVWAQIPGQAPMWIDKGKVADFKHDNPEGKVKE